MARQVGYLPRSGQGSFTSSSGRTTFLYPKAPTQGRVRYRRSRQVANQVRAVRRLRKKKKPRNIPGTAPGALERLVAPRRQVRGYPPTRSRVYRRLAAPRPARAPRATARKNYQRYRWTHPRFGPVGMHPSQRRQWNRSRWVKRGRY